MVEQKPAYPEIDGRDTEPATVHQWFDDGSEPVACLRVLRDGGEARAEQPGCPAAAIAEPAWPPG